MFKIFKTFDYQRVKHDYLSCDICLFERLFKLEKEIPDYMSDITTLLSTKGTKASDILPGIQMPQDANA